MPCGHFCGVPHARGGDEGGGDDGRDARATAAATARASGRERLAPAPLPSAAWNGAYRRMASAGAAPSRADERRFVAVPGRYVPVGFGRYVQPEIDLNDYEYYRLAGWRVAVPRAMPGERVRDLLYRIFFWGPQSAGFKRMGDTLVPAILEPGDSLMLSQSAVGYEEYPLTP